MALETNTPQLTLEHMSLGSQERLEAGIREGITRNLTSGYQNYSLCLFSGRRPSPEEIKNGIYFLQGSAGQAQLCGVYNISVGDYIELSAEGAFALDGRIANSTAAMVRQLRPAKMSDFLDTDGYTVRHHLFKRRKVYSPRSSSLGQTMTDLDMQLGNGAAPTWALMYPWGSLNGWTDFLEVGGSSATSKIFRRRDGKSVFLRPYAARPNASYYLTVGDIVDDPTANLVLRKGAEKGQTSKPSQVSIHRLKYAMPKTKTASITFSGG